jgi:hypothetical protein
VTAVTAPQRWALLPTSDIFASASSTVKRAAFCRGGKSLKVAMQSLVRHAALFLPERLDAVTTTNVLDGRMKSMPQNAVLARQRAAGPPGGKQVTRLFPLLHSAACRMVAGFPPVVGIYASIVPPVAYGETKIVFHSRFMLTTVKPYWAAAFRDALSGSW